MENKYTKQLESSSIGVFQLSGEPAIVINGVPNISPSEFNPIISDSVNEAEPQRNTCFGDWLEGREVRKLFGEEYYSGTVTKFDTETGWYRVVYEDGDFEDLELKELQEVLVPLDITIPLKALAMKIISKSQKPIHKYGKKAVHSQNRRAKNMGSKGKNIKTDPVHDASLARSNSLPKVRVDVCISSKADDCIQEGLEQPT